MSVEDAIMTCIFLAQHVVLVPESAMDALDCAVRLSLTFLYLLLSANVILGYETKDFLNLDKNTSWLFE